jgi:hypothetical protein
MPLKSTYVFGSIMAALALFSLGYWYITSSSSGYTPPSTYTNTTPSPFEPRIVTVSHETDYAIATGSYPQFDKASTELNKTIADVVTKAIDEHAEISEENWKGRYETATPEERKDLTEKPIQKEKYTFFVEWEAPLANEHRASIALHYGGYSGGAHGNSNIATFAYNYDTKKMLMLKDLFPHNQNYLKKLSEESRTQLLGILAKKAGLEQSDIDTDFLNAGTEPKEENFSRFTISPDESSVKIYFDVYQVAAYVFGEQEIVLPLPTATRTPDWLK